MVGCFIYFEQLHIFAANDRDDHALGALHADPVEQRICNRAFCGFERTALALGFACTHHRLAHLAHHRANVGKVQIDEARHHHQISDRTHALLQHFIRQLERFLESCLCLGDQEQVLVWNHDQRIDVLLQLINASLGRAHPPRTFEQEWLGHNSNRQHTLAPCGFRDDRCCASTRTATHAGSDENHVHAFQRVFDFLDRFFRRSLADFGSSARAQTACDLWSKLDLAVSLRDRKRLRVSVGTDEIDAFDFGLDHVGDSVSARPANSDNSDAGTKLVARSWSDIDTHQFSSGRAGPFLIDHFATKVLHG